MTPYDLNGPFCHPNYYKPRARLVGRQGYIVLAALSVIAGAVMGVVW